jgi:hypothetical protein
MINNLTIQRDSMYEATSLQTVSLNNHHYLQANVIKNNKNYYFRIIKSLIMGDQRWEQMDY